MSTEQISVKAEIPEGLPKASVNVFFDPVTADEHEAVVQACGGPGAFRIDYGTGTAWAYLDGFAVCLRSPMRIEQPVPPEAAFVSEFRERAQHARDLADPAKNPVLAEAERMAARSDFARMAAE